MNNLSLYSGLIDARVSASEKDLAVNQACDFPALSLIMNVEILS